MNPFALLAVFFALTTIILWYALIASSDENKQLRLKCNGLWRAQIASESHLAAASGLWEYCRSVEARNNYLEALFVDFKGLIAGARLAHPSGINVTEKLSLREGQETP